ncbi:glycosyltransferase [Intestinibacillus sp. NTUH-41-i26]|uniref:glycosyltransferase n=1 Tax=Butyricicoccaceae TaxID=3085642 RepID=UPI000D1E30EA|nr:MULTISPECIES: glycosyltransferase [Butyricicoccaceae]WOC74607.1 glycosyltransferase [Intestinibacillus sp. NTUH-41-i26]
MKNHIVCLSTTNYHPLPTRKQNVMSRLRNAEVLYFDPPVSVIAPLKAKKASAYLSKYKRPGEKVEGHENITVYALPPVLPFFNKFRWVNRLNQKRQAAFVRRKMCEHGFGEETVLWCYSPSSCDIAAHVPHRALVYDCVDRHSAYKGHIDPVVVDRMERDLAGVADQVFATAVGLAETLEKVNPTTKMIPNGAAYEIFSRVQTEKGSLPCPEDMKSLKHPVFGFVGMLQECIDYALIEKLAKDRPDATVFLIGRTLPGVDLSHLRQYPNIVFHGLVPQPELPAYLAQMDVCLNVFRAGALSRDVSPLKFYEYLATGKPVVSTREPLQVEDFADVVYIAHDADEFIAMCDAAATENDPEKVAKRLAYGAQCSWSERVRQIEAVLYGKGVLHES